MQFFAPLAILLALASAAPLEKKGDVCDNVHYGKKCIVDTGVLVGATSPDAADGTCVPNKGVAVCALNVCTSQTIGGTCASFAVGVSPGAGACTNLVKDEYLCVGPQ